MQQAQIDEYLHKLRATLPEEDAISHLLEQTTGSTSTACPTDPRPYSCCACIPSLRGACVLRMWMAYRLQLAAETDCQRNLELHHACVYEIEQRLGVAA